MSSKSSKSSGKKPVSVAKTSAYEDYDDDDREEEGEWVDVDDPAIQRPSEKLEEEGGLEQKSELDIEKLLAGAVEATGINREEQIKRRLWWSFVNHVDASAVDVEHLQKHAANWHVKEAEA